MNKPSLILSGKVQKRIGAFLAVIMLNSSIFPTVSLALTSGPSQPEVQSFEPIGTSDMVDIFSGDFNYNLPLMKVGNYPINLFYHGGIGMDDEASWVGLGWNINPGNINRQMRGIPDDFKNDKIEKSTTIKPNNTYTATAGLGFEFWGLDVVQPSYGIYYNNYKGLGQSVNLNIGINQANIGFGYDTQSGIDVDVNLSLAGTLAIKDGIAGMVRGSVSVGYNSRGGLRGLTLGLKAGAIQGDGYAGSSFSGMLSFAGPTFTPNVNPDMVNRSYSLGYSYGGSFLGAYGKLITLRGSFNSQRLKNKSVEYESLGYLYAGDYDYGKEDSKMLDFNRDKDSELSKTTKYLHTTVQTYDAYSISGQGTGGSFRPYRDNIGAVADPKSKVTALGGGSGALEMSVGTHFGVDVTVITSKSEVGRWKNEDEFMPFSKLNYTDGEDYVSNGPLAEPVYMKTMGDMAPNDQAFYNKFGDTEAVYFPLRSEKAHNYTVKDSLYSNGIFKRKINQRITRSSRDKRNQSVTYLTADEAQYLAVDKSIKYYEAVKNYGGDYTLSSGAIIPNEKTLNRGGNKNVPHNYKKPHHISEVVVTNTDGGRYVYGIAAYNTVQNDYTFNVNPNLPQNSVSGGLVSFQSSDLTNNQNGRDRYTSKTKTPAYAHSYLLTCVLSADYIDVTGNGPTEDDYGDYTKINYLQAHDNYGWKTPTNPGKANYNKGLRSDTRDDKGTFIEGKKELWYVYSIESKTQIAIFTLKPRNDGLGTNNNGTTYAIDGNKKLLYIDKIELYSKTDYNNNGANAIPIKTVHFEYDYSLCKGIPNSTGSTIGKLTLKKVWFTYGKNDKGRLSPYIFDYNEDNPNYNSKETDRWGNYKEHLANTPANDDFPYTAQNLSAEDRKKQAGVWCLHKITMPSGGKITISYDKDDYAYVQDKPAMNMVPITGLSNNTNTPTSSIFSGPIYNIKHNNRIHFTIPGGNTATADDVKNKYLKGITWLYYNFLINIDSEGANKEYVGGYAEIIDAGITSPTQGYIDIKPVAIGTGPESDKERPVNPIAKTAWQFTRLYRPEIVYPQSEGIGANEDPGLGDMVGVLQLISGFWDDLNTMALGFNQAVEMGNFCKTIEKDNGASWIRLVDIDGHKIGGGSRVEKIEFTDEWESLTDDSGHMTATYGQEYEYTTETGESSGVASYEPLIGGDENPFKVPLYVANNEIPMGPDNSFFMDGPIGESHFPGPSVGYSRVTVKNILPSTNIPVKNRAGKVVHEFYTAKDFPTLVNFTKLTKIIPKAIGLKSIFSAFFGSTKKSGAASQGFTVETNDMHGKPKAQSVYAENQTTPISKTEYFYKTQDGLNETKKLVSEAKLVTPEGNIIDGTLGKEIDMVVDTRYAFERSSNYGVNFNTEVVFGLPIPFPFPSIGNSKNFSYMVTTTKIINRSGLLDRVVVHKDGSNLETYNILYDSESGEVLLTKTQNEFEDFEYNFNYPAHWVYDGMGQAYKNINSRGNITIADGLISTYLDIFVPGDEVGLWQDDEFIMKAWVLDEDASNVSFIDINGNPISDGTYEYKIIRSGRRNQHSTPIGSLQTRNNILNTGATALDINVDKAILNASAIEMSDKWQMHSGEGLKSASENTSCCIKVYDRLYDKGQCLIDLFENIIPVGLLQTNKVSVNNPSGCFGGSVGAYCYSSSATTSASTLPEPLANKAKLTMNFYESATPCSTAANLIGTFQMYCLQPTTEFDFEDFAKTGKIVNCTSGLPTSIKQQLDDNYNDYLIVSCTLAGITYDFVLLTSYWNNSFTQEHPFTHGVTMECTPDDAVTAGCTIPSGNINPYQVGVRGIWRPKKSYAFNTKRSYAGTNNTTYIKEDGAYQSFIPFWKPTTGGHIKETTLSNNNGGWQWTSEVTKYSPYGFELENVDPLNRYSAAVYGYYNSMPIAVGNNTRYNQLAFDGFEDYKFPSAIVEDRGSCVLKTHWNFVETAEPTQLSTTFKHTGKISLKLTSNTSISNIRIADEDLPLGTELNIYELQSEDRIGLFSPQVGKYIFGAWIYSPNNNYVDNKIVITYYDDANVLLNTTTILADPATRPIEKWIRVESAFTIPASTVKIKVELKNDSDGDCYFDDLRIHPFNGNMKSFVYDPITLRLLSQLDENNYATFYEYDEGGTLIRVKKETERGIMTIQENRQNNSK